MTGGILVARLDNCGDVLLAGPAVRAAATTGRPVHLLCGPRGRAAAEMLPGVTSIIEKRAPWIEPDPMPVNQGDALDLVECVRDLRIQEAAILVSSHQSPLPLALLLRWAGVGRIAAVSHEHAGSLLDIRVPGDPDLHEVRRALLVTEALGFAPPADERLRVDLGHADSPDPADATLLDRQPYVVVHPGATAPARTLTPDRWRSTAATVAQSGRTVVVTSPPEERGLAAWVAGKQPSVIDLGGRLTFRQLAAVLAGADAVVCGNTGPAHLAAAVGTPVVVTFPPTVPVERWRPWGVPHVILGDQGIPCSGCRSRRCPLGDQPCLGSVTSADVVDALDRLTGGHDAGGEP